MSIAVHLPSHLRPRREKVFGPARGIPLDRNAKARIMVYAQAWSAKHQQPGQHRGPLTRAFMEVLETLLWGFHNSRSGQCFPSYEAIAARAKCHRDTVYQAIKALEAADVLTWVNRIVREQVRERDLFGKWATRWRIVRTSNAYLFRDPLPCAPAREIWTGASTSENPAGTQNQEISITKKTADSPTSDLAGMGGGLLRALQQLGQAIARAEEVVAG
jgi:hypothetical protein